MNSVVAELAAPGRDEDVVAAEVATVDEFADGGNGGEFFATVLGTCDSADCARTGRAGSSRIIPVAKATIALLVDAIEGTSG
ncbi:MAG: hypothetical protein WA673_09910 [Candidatus Acidiferrales bacterium]